MYSAGSDSVNSLRILSVHENFEQKIIAFKPLWTHTRSWEECLREILPYITVPIVDYDLVNIIITYYPVIIQRLYSHRLSSAIISRIPIPWRPLLIEFAI